MATAYWHKIRLASRAAPEPARTELPDPGVPPLASPETPLAHGGRRLAVVESPGSYRSSASSARTS
jgi:hypothetical protein